MHNFHLDDSFNDESVDAMMAEVLAKSKTDGPGVFSADEPVTKKQRLEPECDEEGSQKSLDGDDSSKAKDEADKSEPIPVIENEEKEGSKHENRGEIASEKIDQHKEEDKLEG
jgi:hypothetical protein